MRILLRWIIVAVALGATCTPLAAQVMRQLTDRKGDSSGATAIDDAGVAVFHGTTSNVTGSNPQHAGGLVAWTLPGGGPAQLTFLPKGISTAAVSATDDGLTVLFLSPDDPLGTNPDGGMELFTIQSDGSGLTQITDLPFGPERIFDASISGDGSRVVYALTGDPPVPPPDGELFAIDPDGQNEVQLTQFSMPAQVSSPSISDDGSWIVFATPGDPTGSTSGSGTSRLFKVQDDGTGLAQLTTPIVVTDEYDPVVSGNGAQVAFWTSTDEVQIVPITGGRPLMIANGRYPSITDDGIWVYFADLQDEISVVRGNGTLLSQLTSGPAGVRSYAPIVSGGNVRVAFRSSGGEHPGGSNPDGGVELMVMDADGSNVTQLSLNGPASGTGSQWPTELAENGSKILFKWNGLATIAPDGSGLTAVVDAGDVSNIETPTITADGSTVVFSSDDDPLGQNTTNTHQVFLVGSDGTGLTQLTPDDGQLKRFPNVAPDGSVIVFQSIMSTPNGGAQLFAVAPGGGPIPWITDDGDSLIKNPRVSQDGQWVVFHSSTDFDGNNPNGEIQVLRARVDGTLVERITSDPSWSSYNPDIRGDGAALTYVSEADPLGTNADHNFELFHHDASTATTTQLTFTTDGNAKSTRLSGDGATAYFTSDSTFFESPRSAVADLYRVDVASGAIRRASGLRDPRDWSAQYLNNFDDATQFAVDGDGTAVVMRRANSTMENPDFSNELFLVDPDTVGTIEADKTAPATVRWDVQPEPIRYDLIRGDVANLVWNGGTVELGAVTCLADDLPDNLAVDPDQPAPGHVFFYVHRGSQGNLDGPGTWDASAGIGPRVPGAGACAD